MLINAVALDRIEIGQSTAPATSVLPEMTTGAKEGAAALPGRTPEIGAVCDSTSGVVASEMI